MCPYDFKYLIQTASCHLAIVKPHHTPSKCQDMSNENPLKVHTICDFAQLQKQPQVSTDLIHSLALSFSHIISSFLSCDFHINSYHMMSLCRVTSPCWISYQIHKMRSTDLQGAIGTSFGYCCQMWTIGGCRGCVRMQFQPQKTNKMTYTTAFLYLFVVMCRCFGL